MPQLAASLAEQRIVLHGVSWQTYEALLADTAESCVPRMAYDSGSLEMMTPLDRHEDCRIAIRRMIEMFAEVHHIPFRGKGSRTFKREDLAKGLEADEWLYIRNQSSIRGKRELDLAIDPPPDLALEIDITGSSLDKRAIYAALGVAELWCFDGETLSVWVLEVDGSYLARDDSLNLPGFPISAAAEWIERFVDLDETAWVAALREWLGRQA